MLSQHNARILKLVSPTALDRSFLSQWRAQNPDALIIYRHYFGDNNLNDVNGRAQAIVNAVSPYRDLIDVVETGYNECNEGINDGIRDLAQAEMRIAWRLRQNLEGIKIAGGCFSVGTPYNDVTRGQFQDIEAYAAAFAHLDYWAPHEYRDPMPDDGHPVCQRQGLRRHCLALSLRNRLGERGGRRLCRRSTWASSAWTAAAQARASAARGPSIMGYMQWAGYIAQFLMEDIRAGHLVGAAFFCVGQQDPDSWGSFDLAGENAFQGLLSEQFGVVTENRKPT